MKPAPFAYLRPETEDEALDLLREHGDEARILAGGQSLVPLMSMRRVSPAAVVDITRLPGLAEVRDGQVAGAEVGGAEAGGAEVGGAEVGGTEVAGTEVGALVTQYGLEQRAGIDDALRECLPYTGHYATRHRGTVGGSIAYGEPRGELPVVLLALAGRARVRSRDAEREIAADELYVGPYATTLRADELLVSTRWPAAGLGRGSAFTELALRQGDFTLACAACAVTVRDGAIVAARVAVGAVADRPLLVGPAAEALVADGPRAAAAATRATIPGYGDHHASARYRRHLAGELVADAAARAIARAGGAPMTEGGADG
ncbi:MAG: FAD binding domain-containing protein [Solirubrobacterales bacterium]|nr:FAD binding domain-containing protein [Solirubrobacterales bacterium]